MADNIIERINRRLKANLEGLQNYDISADKLDDIVSNASDNIRIAIVEALAEVDRQQAAIGHKRELSEDKKKLISDLMNTGTVAIHLGIFLSNDLETAKQVLTNMDENIRQQAIEELELCNES